jgi:hypothetical protein
VSDDVQTLAAARLEEALAARGARDPREYYRERLRELKEQDPGAYEKAVAHYRDTLLPSIADGTAEPLAAWTEYGRRLADLLAPGRTVTLDEHGRARTYVPPAGPEDLVLHLPDGRRAPTLLVGLPGELSPAQRAAFDWLVQGRTSLREPS